MEWPRVKLRDVAQIVMGQSPPGETYNDVGDGLPFFQGKADFGDQFATPRKWCTAPSRVAQAGDILLSVRAPVGPTNIAREKSCIGRGLAAIRAIPGRADQDYLRFFLRHQEPSLARQGQGSTFSAIKRAEVEGVRIPLPPLSEQRRIVEILDQADRLRRLHAEADAKADRILPALFLKMFGDPAKSWDSHRLGNLLRKKRGALQSGPFGTHLHNSDFVPSGTVLAVGIDNVLDGEFVLGRNRRISSEKHRELAKYTLEQGDVLITIMGTVGRVCVFPDLPSPAICTKHVYRIQVDDRIHPEYLCALLRFSQNAKAQLGASVSGQIVAGIKSTDLLRLQLPVPPRKLQDDFATRRVQLDTARCDATTAREAVESLFSQILHRAFSGSLTASWREAHMKDLLQEMEQQAKALAEVMP